MNDRITICLGMTNQMNEYHILYEFLFSIAIFGETFIKNILNKFAYKGQF